MSAAKRRSGNGLVIALVVFIVLALTGIGTSIWLYQQKAMMQQAIDANQMDFEEQVASVFEDENWDLSTRADASFGVRYGEDAFGDVKSKLRHAALLEDIRPVIGWDSPESITDRLNESPAQKAEQEQYESVRGLLGFYEQEYGRLKKRIEELNTDLESERSKLKEKRSAMDETQKDLNQEIENLDDNYKDEIARLQKQYEEMQEEYEDARDDVKQSQEKINQAKKEWDNKLAEIQKEAEDWEQLYNEATAEEEAVTELEPAGSILDVEPRYEFVVIEGGDEAGWEKGDNIIIYTRSAAGERTVKGKAVINNVYETTSLATILNQSAQLLEDDFFVLQSTWKRYQEEQRKMARESSSSPTKPPTTDEDADTSSTTDQTEVTDQEEVSSDDDLDSETTGGEETDDSDSDEEEDKFEFGW